MPRATRALRAIQSAAGSLGTALLAAVLQRSILGELPGFHGNLSLSSALAALNPAHTTPGLAHAFGVTFWIAVGLTALALIPALFLPETAREEPQQAVSRPRRS